MSDSALHQEPAMRLLMDLIQDRTGIRYDQSRYSLLLDKISPLLEEGNFRTIADYYDFLKKDPVSANGWIRLQSVLAVNESYFWREYDQIAAVSTKIVPRLQLARPNTPVRIWHAACATGEEPYTMAISLLEAGCYARSKIDIFATDFNVVALEKAQEGVFRQRSFRSIPPHIFERYFKPRNEKLFAISPSIREKVRFMYLNLMDGKTMNQMPGYDIIFCRNAFIYFSEQAIRQVVEWFYRDLQPEGYLFVGSSESLSRITNLYDLVEINGAFGYQKGKRNE